MSKQEWGVVQRLKIDADTLTSLVAGIKIALTQHHQITHWKVCDGILIFLWSDDKREAQPFLTPLKDPEVIAQVVLDWLKDSSEYPQEPDTDGSTRKGYSLDIDYGYVVLKVRPKWIVYGK